MNREVRTDFDLDDPTLLLRDDVVADPRALYDVLRRRAPVWRLPGQDSYLVADPDLIREVVGRTSEFSSNLVSLLHRGGDGHLVPFQMASLGDTINVLATADPPVHTRHRKLLQPHLSPAAVGRQEPTLRQIVDRLLVPLLAAGRGDVVAGLGDPLPALAICNLLGLPPEDAAHVVPLVTKLSPLLDGVTDLDGMGQAAAAAMELHEYSQVQLASERTRPAAERSGLLAVLVDAIESQAITADEARNILMQFFTAGTETTSSLIASSIEILAQRPDLQARLWREPERIPAAIEEILAEDGPFQFHYRWTTTDTRLGQTHIPANSRVLLLWSAANRPSPDGPRNRDAEGGASAAHYAFGRGLHFCIGAPLARLESRIAIERLLASTSRVSLDPEHPPVRRPSILLRRHQSLPVTLESPRQAPSLRPGE